MKKFENVSPDLKERARACTTPEELMSLAAESGIDLSEEELSSISGGTSWSCVTDCSSFDCAQICNSASTATRSDSGGTEENLM